MNVYSRAQLVAGLPVEYELGCTTAELVEKRGKQLLSRSKSLLVQLICYGTAGYPVAYFNGLFYLGCQEPLILTTAHVLEWGGAVRYTAAFDSEEGIAFTSDLELIKAGAVIPNLAAVQPQAHEYSPDLAVFRCTSSLPSTSSLVAPLPPRAPAIGDKTYIMAYEGAARALGFTDGIVSTVSWDKYTTTAYADRGYSGSPVVDMRGFLLGIVQRGSGIAISEVSFLPANTIQTFLQTGSPQLPGLPAIG